MKIVQGLRDNLLSSLFSVFPTWPEIERRIYSFLCLNLHLVKGAGSLTPEDSWNYKTKKEAAPHNSQICCLRRGM